MQPDWATETGPASLLPSDYPGCPASTQQAIARLLPLCHYCCYSAWQYDWCLSLLPHVLLNISPAAVPSTQQAIWYLIKKRISQCLIYLSCSIRKISSVSPPLNIFDLHTAPQIYIKYAIIFQISRAVSLERFTWSFTLAHGAWEKSGSLGPGKLFSLHCSFQVWSGADTHSPTFERDSMRHSCASMS